LKREPNMNIFDTVYDFCKEKVKPRLFYILIETLLQGQCYFYLSGNSIDERCRYIDRHLYIRSPDACSFVIRSGTM